MQMKRNGPWGSALAPQLHKAFLKEPIGEIWGKLRISTTSHGFLVWFGKIITFWLIAPTHSTPSPYLSLVAPFARSTMVVQGGGGDVTA
jgi:hypothetical protein